MNLLIGCPVAHRAWVLPRWFRYLETACAFANVEPRYAFVLDPADESWPVVRKYCPRCIVVPRENTKADDTRVWREGRYEEMAALRNHLLRAVREDAPEAFLSVDSDILVHPRHLASMINALDEYSAVGGKCYMTPTGTRFPSYGLIGRDGQLVRQDAHGLFAVEVIMALKLMSPEAYLVDYELDLHGEDIGWSNAARRAGLRLGWDGRYTSKHVMRPEDLDVIDPRVGF